MKSSLYLSHRTTKHKLPRIAKFINHTVNRRVQALITLDPFKEDSETLIRETLNMADAKQNLLHNFIYDKEHKR